MIIFLYPTRVATSNRSMSQKISLLYICNQTRIAYAAAQSKAWVANSKELFNFTQYI